jgi:Co/Zn/Cd efflux system component
MSDACCEQSAHSASAPVARHRGVLWTVLAINLGLFAVELVAGLRAGSSALLGDSLDMLGDTLVGAGLAALWLRTSWRVLGEAWRGERAYAGGNVGAGR